MENIEDMRTNAILEADGWFRSLPLKQQIYVQELASRTMSQGIVMFADGDRRRGLDMFPEAWRIVRNPPLATSEGDK